MSKVPSSSPAAIKNALLAGALPISAGHRLISAAQQGAGVLNAPAAISALKTLNQDFLLLNDTRFPDLQQNLRCELHIIVKCKLMACASVKP